MHIGKPTLLQCSTPWNVGVGEPQRPKFIHPRSACPGRYQADDNGRGYNGECGTQSPTWDLVARYQRPAPQLGIDLMGPHTFVGRGEVVGPDHLSGGRVKHSGGSRGQTGRTRWSTRGQNP